jgi:putative spermidine/putrescine transport system ATP-binding protein
VTDGVSLRVEGLVRRYARDSVVGPISFEVNEGEFFSLLGPSGCGKSTTLRSIAGFERPDEGTITLAGNRIDQKPPFKRDVGLVFQNHALFSHLTVAQNIAFGLDLRKVPKAQIEQRVVAMLALVGLSGYGARMPSQISGGQQQRVALARSLILEPPLLLLDEPLSSLDLKLRVQMREELRGLQRRLRKTTIFVTHDQTEALVLSDRIAVLSEGRIEQIGTPREIYNSPASCFVADFIGSSNLLKAEVVAEGNGQVELMTEGGLRLMAAAPVSPKLRQVTALVRPERISLLTGESAARLPAGAGVFPARVLNVSYQGEDTHVRVAAGNSESLLIALKSGGAGSEVIDAENVHARIEAQHVRILER